MTRNSLLLILFFFVFSYINSQRATPDIIQSNDGDITIQPITHGTLVLQWNNKTIYVDPYGGADAFKGIAKPDIILITDIHGDHLNLETLAGLDTENTSFIVPQAVADKLKDKYEKQLVIMQNGGIHVQSDIFLTLYQCIIYQKILLLGILKEEEMAIFKPWRKNNLYKWRYRRYKRNA